jgi:opacity protein-like surface antigen
VARTALSIDGALLVSESLTYSPADSNLSATSSIEETRTLWGLAGGGFGFGIAHGVSNNFVFGGQLLFSTQNTQTKAIPKDNVGVAAETTTVETTSYSLTPRLEYVFADSAAVRPFIAGMFGVSGSTASSDGGEFSRNLVTYGAGAGLHVFVSPNFSIDPLLSFQGANGSQGKNKELDVSGHLIALTVSVSGWFGGTAPAAEPPEQNETLPVQSEPPPSQRFREPEPEPDADAPGASALKTTQILPGDHAMMLKGRPEAVPDTVLLRLAENPKSSTLQSCRDIRLVVGGRFYRLENVTAMGRLAVAGQARFVTKGTLPVHALDAAVVAEDSHFNLCGESWPLTPAVRESFRFFLGEFRQRGGTPPVPVAEPMPTDAPAPADAPAAPGTPATSPAPAPSPEKGVPAPPAAPPTPAPAPAKAPGAKPAPARPAPAPPSQ